MKYERARLWLKNNDPYLLHIANGKPHLHTHPLIGQNYIYLHIALTLPYVNMTRITFIGVYVIYVYEQKISI